MDPLRNPKDPLHKASPEAGRELFKRMGQLVDEFPFDAILDAAFNLILNSIRQQNASWPSAEAAYDEKIGRVKTVLRDHYDANGKRRNVFPFDQVVVMDHFKDPDKVN